MIAVAVFFFVISILISFLIWFNATLAKNRCVSWNHTYFYKFIDMKDISKEAWQRKIADCTNEIEVDDLYVIAKFQKYFILEMVFIFVFVSLSRLA